jgi:pyrroline-5-carboxylate reductase
MNNVLIVGAGNMGEAMLKGWLKANNMLKQVYVREPDPSNWLKKVHKEKKSF